MGHRSKKTKLSEIESRRSFLNNAFMGTGLVASHLFAGGLAVRYLYPQKIA